MSMIHDARRFGEYRQQIRSRTPRSAENATRETTVDQAPPQKESAAPYSWLKTEIMPTERWMCIRDNPKQRDVKERIAKGRASHLMTFDEAHTKVAIAQLPDGSRYKADGHTRCFIWANHRPTGVPSTVIADVWRCADIDAVKALYDKFDNSVTTETGSDRVTGAAKECGIEFQSKMMRAGEISSAVRWLWQYIYRTTIKRGEKEETIGRAIKLFESELVVLDGCEPTRKRFPACVVVAAIVTLRGDREAALHFWKNYAQGLGEKSEGRRDAITVFEERLPGILKKDNGIKEREAIGQAIGAVFAYTEDKRSVKRAFSPAKKEEIRAYVNKYFVSN